MNKYLEDAEQSIAALRLHLSDKNKTLEDMGAKLSAALEEIERLKAPASEGEIAETLKELREVGFYCEATVQDVIEIIESLAAKVAELEDDKRCLTVANEAMTNQANNAITRAERAEAALAEAERKGAAKQAEIDRLMLEFCPGEMTPEQLAEWGRHQRAEFKE